jgi:hypothetical protein
VDVGDVKGGGGGGGGDGTRTWTQFEMGPPREFSALSINPRMEKNKGTSNNEGFLVKSRVKDVSEPGASGNGVP